MPDKKGKLSDEEKSKIKGWLELKWKSGKICEICGENYWQVIEQLIAPISYSNGFILGGSTSPQVMVVCTSCGSTKYFNAIAIGLLSSSKEETKNG